MYHWGINIPSKSGLISSTRVVGFNNTLHAVIDAIAKYTQDTTVRDFYINGHHMNEEFDLWIKNGKFIHDDGQEFVPMNKWYELLRMPDQFPEASDVMARFTVEMQKAFRPQSTRGMAPQNPATLAAKEQL